ncbi:hypothetical protein HOL24_01420 [bacterium]|jgi:hypothetical protein|nr:hypothetical protein [bacterium]
MHRILHRVNTKGALLKTPKELGVEVDIRSKGNQLIMHHDPFQDGEDFEDWLGVYEHGILILNVKEEGLEGRLIELMSKYNIDDYFFLDQSFPFLVKTSNDKEKRCAVRVSEFESVDTAISLANKVDWIWVDCFTHFPLTAHQVEKLRTEFKFKLCFVSPELQGRADIEHVKGFIQEIKFLGIKGDAVCTKYPELWV